MKFKKGISILGVRPELLFGLMVVESTFQKLNADLVITSVCDSKHSVTSLHYAGCAADIRIRHLSPEKIQVITNALNENLTEDFDVVLEKDHIHIEYQPRKSL